MAVDEVFNDFKCDLAYSAQLLIDAAIIIFSNAPFRTALSIFASLAPSWILEVLCVFQTYARSYVFPSIQDFFAVCCAEELFSALIKNALCKSIEVLCY